MKFLFARSKILQCAVTEHLESGRAMFSKKAPISRVLMT